MDKILSRHQKFWMIGILGTVGVVIFSSQIFGANLFCYVDTLMDSYFFYSAKYEYIIQAICTGQLQVMDFANGLGSTTFFNLNLLMDPFSCLVIILGVVFGVNNAGYFLVFAQLLRFFCTGILSFNYLRNFNISYYSSLIVSICVAYCGYNMQMGQFYEYGTYIFFLLCILIILEKAFLREKFFVYLSLVVAYIAMAGCWMTFNILLFSGFYCVIRLLQIEKCNWIVAGTKCLKAYAAFIVGIFISAVVFLPNANEIISVTGRVKMEGQSFLRTIFNYLRFYSWKQIGEIFAKFFSENLFGAMNCYLGYFKNYPSSPHLFLSPILLLCIPQYCRNIYLDKRSKKQKMILFVVVGLLLLSIITQFVPAMFNFFTYETSRHVFWFIPIFSVVMGITLDQIVIQKRYSRILNIFTATVCFLALWLILGGLNKVDFYTIMIPITIFMVAAFLFDWSANNLKARQKFKEKGISTEKLQLFSYQPKHHFTENMLENKKARIIFYCFLILVIINTISESMMSINFERGLVSKETYRESRELQNVHNALKLIQDEEGDNFCRVETLSSYSLGPLDSNYHRYRSTSNYIHILNGNTREFVRQFGDPTKHIANVAWYGAGSYGAWYENQMANLLGLKYIISDVAIPFRYWSLFSQSDDLYIYQNQLIDSAGIFYDQYITEEEYKTLSELDKKMIASDAVVLNKELHTQMERKEIIREPISDVLGLNLLEVNNTWVNSLSTNKINISAFEGGTLTIPVDYRLLQEENMRYLLEFTIFGKSQGQVKISYYLGESLYDNNESFFLYPTENQVVISELPAGTSKICITFPQGEFDCKNIQLYATNYKTNSGTTAFKNIDMSNVVEGEASIYNDSLLYIPIPYELGWKAYVDGIETEIIKANFGFQAIILPKGNHFVRFEYVSVPFKVGLILSIIGFSIIGGLLVSCNEATRKRMRRIFKR